MMSNHILLHYLNFAVTQCLQKCLSYSGYWVKKSECEVKLVLLTFLFCLFYFPRMQNKEVKSDKRMHSLQSTRRVTFIHPCVSLLTDQHFSAAQQLSSCLVLNPSSFPQHNDPWERNTSSTLVIKMMTERLLGSCFCSCQSCKKKNTERKTYWLAFWSSFCFARLLSTYLRTLLSGTHSSQLWKI